MIDLSDAPVVDTHLHGWRTPELLTAPAESFADRVTMLGMCVLTSGGDPADYAAVLERATATTPLALALLARLGAQLGCEPTSEAVSAARLERLGADATGYLQELWRDARIEGLVVDEGFPLPIIPAGSSGRPAFRFIASSASSPGSPRSAPRPPATTSWRMRWSRASRPPSPRAPWRSSR
jgi:hypothetical protein